ncbi:glutamate receptor ionotropic, delta-1-like [Centruroides sculpturatus]|uniref:glutamate receptor ionotropic, delta-1-like n=1 Tax=Centruroides sculpturatus TaxID=218467 RepID=UPI000C6E376E|nr:glutamate receptor ionotropic, delta-1-like [Centruroides sculpturatus]
MPVWRIAGIQNKYIMEFDKNEEIILSGVHFKSFKIIQEQLKVNYRIVKPIARKISGKSGIIGQLLNNEADIAFFPLLVRKDRSEILSYSTSTTVSEIKFVIRAPPDKNSWNTLTKPFSIQVWFMIFITFVLFGFTLDKVIREECQLSRMTYTWTKNKIFWFMFGSFTDQGGNLHYISGSRSRLLMSIWLLAVLTIATSYGGTLISFLTTQIPQYVPRTIHELASEVSNGEYTCGTEFGSAVTKLVLGSQSGDAKILADNVKENNNVNTLGRAFNKVVKEDFALITKDYILSKFVDEHGPENFLISKDSFVTLPTAYLMKKDYQYRENITCYDYWKQELLQLSMI